MRFSVVHVEVLTVVIQTGQRPYATCIQSPPWLDNKKISLVSIILTPSQHRPSPAMSPFWFGDDISRDGPGGDKKVTSPGTKKASMSLGLAEKRLFVINNGRVVEDGATPAGCLGEVTNNCTVSKDVNRM